MSGKFGRHTSWLLARSVLIQSGRTTRGAGLPLLIYRSGKETTEKEEGKKKSRLQHATPDLAHIPLSREMRKGVGIVVADNRQQLSKILELINRFTVMRSILTLVVWSKKSAQTHAAVTQCKLYLCVCIY